MKKLIAIASILLFSAMASAQCPMCKTALTSNRGQKALNRPVVGNGINKGILFLLTTPYILVGSAGVYYFSQKRKQRLNGK